MSCLILGDSIAVGLSQIIKGCYISAQIGASSAAIVDATPYMTVDHAYISSGSNSVGDPMLLQYLAMTRAKISSPHVVWIVPIDPSSDAAVRNISNIQHDKHVAFVPGPDNVHPRSYYDLAQDARGK